MDVLAAALIAASLGARCDFRSCPTVLVTDLEGKTNREPGIHCNYATITSDGRTNFPPSGNYPCMLACEHLDEQYPPVQTLRTCPNQRMSKVMQMKLEIDSGLSCKSPGITSITYPGHPTEECVCRRYSYETGECTEWESGKTEGCVPAERRLKDGIIELPATLTGTVAVGTANMTCFSGVPGGKMDIDTCRGDTEAWFFPPLTEKTPGTCNADTAAGNVSCEYELVPLPGECLDPLVGQATVLGDMVLPWESFYDQTSIAACSCFDQDITLKVATRPASEITRGNGVASDKAGGKFCQSVNIAITSANQDIETFSSIVNPGMQSRPLVTDADSIEVPLPGNNNTGEGGGIGSCNGKVNVMATTNLCLFNMLNSDTPVDVQPYDIFVASNLCTRIYNGYDSAYFGSATEGTNGCPTGGTENSALFNETLTQIVQYSIKNFGPTETGGVDWRDETFIQNFTSLADWADTCCMQVVVDGDPECYLHRDVLSAGQCEYANRAPNSGTGKMAFGSKKNNKVTDSEEGVAYEDAPFRRVVHKQDDWEKVGKTPAPYTGAVCKGSKLDTYCGDVKAPTFRSSDLESGFNGVCTYPESTTNDITLGMFQQGTVTPGSSSLLGMPFVETQEDSRLYGLPYLDRSSGSVRWDYVSEFLGDVMPELTPSTVGNAGLSWVSSVLMAGANECLFTDGTSTEGECGAGFGIIGLRADSNVKFTEYQSNLTNASVNSMRATFALYGRPNENTPSFTERIGNEYVAKVSPYGIYPGKWGELSSTKLQNELNNDNNINYRDLCFGQTQSKLATFQILPIAECTWNQCCGDGIHIDNNLNEVGPQTPPIFWPGSDSQRLYPGDGMFGLFFASQSINNWGDSQPDKLAGANKPYSQATEGAAVRQPNPELDLPTYELWEVSSATLPRCSCARFNLTSGGTNMLCIPVFTALDAEADPDGKHAVPQTAHDFNDGIGPMSFMAADFLNDDALQGVTLTSKWNTFKDSFKSNSDFYKNLGKDPTSGQQTYNKCKNLQGEQPNTETGWKLIDTPVDWCLADSDAAFDELMVSLNITIDPSKHCTLHTNAEIDVWSKLSESNPAMDKKTGAHFSWDVTVRNNFVDISKYSLGAPYGRGGDGLGQTDDIWDRIVAPEDQQFNRTFDANTFTVDLSLYVYGLSTYEISVFDPLNMNCYGSPSPACDSTENMCPYNKRHASWGGAFSAASMMQSATSDGQNLVGSDLFFPLQSGMQFNQYMAIQSDVKLCSESGSKNACGIGFPGCCTSEELRFVPVFDKNVFWAPSLRTQPNYPFGEPVKSSGYNPVCTTPADTPIPGPNLFETYLYQNCTDPLTLQYAPNGAYGYGTPDTGLISKTDFQDVRTVVGHYDCEGQGFPGTYKDGGVKDITEKDWIGNDFMLRCLWGGNNNRQKVFFLSPLLPCTVGLVSPSIQAYSNIWHNPASDGQSAMDWDSYQVIAAAYGKGIPSGTKAVRQYSLSFTPRQMNGFTISNADLQMPCGLGCIKEKATEPLFGDDNIHRRSGQPAFYRMGGILPYISFANFWPTSNGGTLKALWNYFYNTTFDGTREPRPIGKRLAFGAKIQEARTLLLNQFPHMWPGVSRRAFAPLRPLRKVVGKLHEDDSGNAQPTCSAKFVGDKKFPPSILFGGQRVIQCGNETLSAQAIFKQFAKNASIDVCPLPFSKTDSTGCFESHTMPFLRDRYFEQTKKGSPKQAPSGFSTTCQQQLTRMYFFKENAPRTVGWTSPVFDFPYKDVEMLDVGGFVAYDNSRCNDTEADCPTEDHGLRVCLLSEKAQKGCCACGGGDRGKVGFTKLHRFVDLIQREQSRVQDDLRVELPWFVGGAACLDPGCTPFMSYSAFFEQLNNYGHTIPELGLGGLGPGLYKNNLKEGWEKPSPDRMRTLNAILQDRFLPDKTVMRQAINDGRFWNKGFEHFLNNLVSALTYRIQPNGAKGKWTNDSVPMPPLFLGDLILAARTMEDSTAGTAFLKNLNENFRTFVSQIDVRQHPAFRAQDSGEPFLFKGINNNRTQFANLNSTAGWLFKTAAYDIFRFLDKIAEFPIPSYSKDFVRMKADGPQYSLCGGAGSLFSFTMPRKTKSDPDDQKMASFYQWARDPRLAAKLERALDLNISSWKPVENHPEFMLLSENQSAILRNISFTIPLIQGTENKPQSVAFDGVASGDFQKALGFAIFENTTDTDTSPLAIAHINMRVPEGGFTGILSGYDYAGGAGQQSQTCMGQSQGVASGVRGNCIVAPEAMIYQGSENSTLECPSATAQYPNSCIAPFWTSDFRIFWANRPGLPRGRRLPQSLAVENNALYAHFCGNYNATLLQEVANVSDTSFIRDKVIAASEYSAAQHNGYLWCDGQSLSPEQRRSMCFADVREGTIPGLNAYVGLRRPGVPERPEDLCFTLDDGSLQCTLFAQSPVSVQALILYMEAAVPPSTKKELILIPLAASVAFTSFALDLKEIPLAYENRLADAFKYAKDADSDAFRGPTRDEADAMYSGFCGAAAGEETGAWTDKSLSGLISFVERQKKDGLYTFFNFRDRSGPYTESLLDRPLRQDEVYPGFNFTQATISEPNFVVRGGSTIPVRVASPVSQSQIPVVVCTRFIVQAANVTVQSIIFDQEGCEKIDPGLRGPIKMVGADVSGGRVSNIVVESLIGAAAVQILGADSTDDPDAPRLINSEDVVVSGVRTSSFSTGQKSTNNAMLATARTSGTVRVDSCPGGECFVKFVMLEESGATDLTLPVAQVFDLTRRESAGLPPVHVSLHEEKNCSLMHVAVVNDTVENNTMGLEVYCLDDQPTTRLPVSNYGQTAFFDDGGTRPDGHNPGWSRLTRCSKLLCPSASMTSTGVPTCFGVRDGFYDDDFTRDYTQSFLLTGVYVEEMIPHSGVVLSPDWTPQALPIPGLKTDDLTVVFQGGAQLFWTIEGDKTCLMYNFSVAKIADGSAVPQECLWGLEQEDDFEGVARLFIPNAPLACPTVIHQADGPTKVLGLYPCSPCATSNVAEEFPCKDPELGRPYPVTTTSQTRFGDFRIGCKPPEDSTKIRFVVGEGKCGEFEALRSITDLGGVCRHPIGGSPVLDNTFAGLSLFSHVGPVCQKGTGNFSYKFCIGAGLQEVYDFSVKCPAGRHLVSPQVCTLGRHGCKYATLLCSEDGDPIVVDPGSGFLDNKRVIVVDAQKLANLTAAVDSLLLLRNSSQGNATLDREIEKARSELVGELEQGTFSATGRVAAVYFQPFEETEIATDGVLVYNVSSLVGLFGADVLRQIDVKAVDSAPTLQTIIAIEAIVIGGCILVHFALAEWTNEKRVADLERLLLSKQD